MFLSLLVVSIVAQAPAGETGTGSLESVRAEYRLDAKKYEFFADPQHKQPLVLVTEPIFSWTSLKDYSGDVFVWTKDGLPILVGCMLSASSGPNRRNMIHEFHLVGESPTPPVDLPSRQRWQPVRGLARTAIDGGPVPAPTAAGRLAQLRQLSRAFAIHMEAVNGNWELRLLPQPLFRYGTEAQEVIDGALFSYVWTTGTDPEFLLMLECRKTPEGPRWHYAPVLFTTRALRLEHNGREVWKIEAHKEPPSPSSLLYTTGFVRMFDVDAPKPVSPTR